MSLDIVKTPSKKITKEMLKINFKKGLISAGLNVTSFIDKDTKQFIFYAPSLQVSGYGDTEQEAGEMMDFAINSFFEYLVSLGVSGIDTELKKLGWTHSPLFKKEYSKAYVDINGELNGFNAEENSIKHLTLTTA